MPGEPRDDVQKADARSRRVAMATVALTLVVGTVLLALADHFRAAWEAWLLGTVEGWIRHPGRGGFWMFVLSAPLWGLAWHLGRLAGRIERAGRWPPPGLAVIRDTRIVTGSGAARRALALRLAALLAWLAPVLCGLWFWRALAAFSG